MKAYEKAMAYYEQAIGLAEEIDYPLGLTRPYTHIGGSHRRNGDLQTALTYYQKALTINQEIGNCEGIVLGLDNVGWATYRLGGDFEAALKHFQRALELAEQMDFKFAIGRTYHVLGELFFREGDGAQALEYFERMAQLSLETGYKSLLGLANSRIEEINQDACLPG
jgi:tetratricopeptide (TPR) repeat protein